MVIIFSKIDEMVRDKILLLGASGFIGRPLFNKLGVVNTIGTYCTKPFKNGVFFDSLNTTLSDVIKNPGQISHAIILLGIVRPDVCAQNENQSQQVNVDSVIKILKQLRSWHIKPIYASSESIFDGHKGNYCEKDPPNPILIYGQQKVKIETFIKDNYEDYVILRIATVVGNSIDDGTVLSNWHNQIIKNEDIKGAIDQIKSPIFIGDLIKAIKIVIKKDIVGTYNVGGCNSYSSYELSNMILKEVKKFITLDNKIIGVSINDFSTVEKRPCNVSMNSSKLWNKIGMKPKNMNIICKELVSSYFSQQ